MGIKTNIPVEKPQDEICLKECLSSESIVSKGKFKDLEALKMSHIF